MASKNGRILHEAYCLECRGGGMSLGTFTAWRSASRTAGSHSSTYSHNVTVLQQVQGETRVQVTK